MDERRELYIADRGDECLAEEVRGFIDEYRTRLRVAKEKCDQQMIDFSTEGLEYYEERLADLERQIAQKNCLPVMHSEAPKDEDWQAEKENHCSAGDNGLLGRGFNALQKLLWRWSDTERNAGYQSLPQQ